MKIGNSTLIEPRRSHGAVIVGKLMVVFGGINTHTGYLKDIKYLDLRLMAWMNLDYEIETQELEEFLLHGIAKHVMVANFENREGSTRLYNKDY